MADKEQNRRKFLTNLGLTAGAGIIGSSFVKPIQNLTAEDCKTTPILELGPYAVMKYRKQADHDIDLTQIEGNAGVAFGQVITVFGKITDKNCKPIQGAIVEIWSANHYGKYHHEYDKSQQQDDPNFQGWGQAITNEFGEYKFKTIYPGPYGSRTRHIHYKVSKRNYHELTTQLFFEGEVLNSKDFILSSFPHEEQQLITRPLVNKDGTKEVEFNITLADVEEGSLPKQVLKEYTGKYTLTNAPFNMQTFMKTAMGIEVTNFDFEITHKKNQLFMTLSFYPTIELGWNAKDEFQSWSFSNTFIRFRRDDKGKVVGMRLYFGEDDYVDAAKKNNR
jgi:protocatechuate 3,4-dioxygenase, beta subunit